MSTLLLEAGCALQAERLAAVERIGRELAGPNADDVDRAARFPREAVDALRRERFLSASVPVELGGWGCGVAELGAMCEALAQHCAATAMIFAMHHIQVASIARHMGGSQRLRRYLEDLSERQYLIASVTSEVGVGGDLRRSVAAVEVSGDRFVLNKDATTVSYGAHADDLLITARRAPDAAPNDQSLVLAHRADTALEQTGGWDTLGMRGTCSPGFKVRAQGYADQVLPEPFAEIASRTMVPYSHLLWCSCWTGIASAAVGKVRKAIRAEARKKPGTTPPNALRLAELMTGLQTLQQSVRAACTDYDRICAAPGAKETLSSLAYAVRINNLKVASSQSAAQIVTQALLAGGIMAYKNDSPFAMGRHLRDVHSAALMVANDRLLATNASLLLVLKDD